jgi:hypothetical protein
MFATADPDADAGCYAVALDAIDAQAGRLDDVQDAIGGYIETMFLMPTPTAPLFDGVGYEAIDSVFIEWSCEHPQRILDLFCVIAAATRSSDPATKAAALALVHTFAEQHAEQHAPALLDRLQAEERQP